MSWIKVILALIVVSIILLSIIEFATSVFFLMKADTQISAVTFVDKSLNKLGNILNPSHQAEKFDWTALQHKNKHSLEEYRTAAWVRDFQSPNIKYYPFSLWRSETNFVSTNVKTDLEGFRFTPSIEKCEQTISPINKKEIKIFLFGGSLVFGDGWLRDKDLLGFKLQCLLTAAYGEPIRIINLGQSGYNLSNSIVVLNQQLLKSQVPDYAVFYFGFNEVAHKIYAGAPHMMYDAISKKVFGQRQEDISPIVNVSQIDKRLEQYFEDLRFSLKYLKNLGEAFDFKTIFIFNPDLFSVSGRHNVDQELLDRVKNSHPILSKIFKEFHSNKDRKTQGLVESIDACFSNKLNGKQVFVDIVHLTPKGNAIAAECVAARIDKGGYFTDRLTSTNRM